MNVKYSQFTFNRIDNLGTKKLQYFSFLIFAEKIWIYIVIFFYYWGIGDTYKELH